ncbi:MAG: site-specific DNA-methyltransferase, partial [Chloroflexi bacterium]|nr:site-specific DNA-methyltransferase [Chloroflexota bacterium]
MSDNKVNKSLRKRKPTRTSAFGSPGRIGHDSSVFYRGNLYQGLGEKPRAPYVETSIVPAHLDHIFCKSSESMEELPDHSIHLMVTSPPYNVGKEYDRDLSLDDYRGLLRRVFREVYRVLVPGGRACINVANLGRKPYIPISSYVIAPALDVGFLMR